MQTDPFESATDSLIAPARSAFPIIPDDAADLPIATKAIYVGTGGDIVLRAVDSDDDAIFVGVPDGAILPIRVRAVRTSTTANNLLGLA